jgi:putative toxin-antitoxin system antitoxin component (TIGR02293 family)
MPATKTLHDPASAKPRAPKRLSYLDVYRATPSERIKMIKSGVPAALVKDLFTQLAMSQSLGFEALKLSAATVNRKALQADNLSVDEGERVLGMAKLVGQVEAMVQDSGNPAGFDAPAWTSRWLREPLPAFGGARPVDFMDTMEGQAMVSRVLAQSQSGAYA